MFIRILMFLMAAIPLMIVTPNQVEGATDYSPKAIQGEVNLIDAGWDFEDDGMLALNGEWAFFWEQLLTPEDIKQIESQTYIQVPKIWGNQSIDGQELTNKGYGTYFLTIRLPDYEVGRTQAIRMPSVATAYKLWINGELLASNGTVGTSLEEMEPQNYPKVVYFTPQTNKVELVLQVSNFVQRKGGLWSEITIGHAGQVSLAREKDILLQMLVAGALLIMGIYHTIVFAFRKTEHSILFFGIACLLICLRTLFVGDVLWYAFIPEFSWEVGVKLEYLTAFIGIGFFVLYTYHLHPEDINKKITYTLFFINVITCLPIVFFPARIYTNAVLFYEVMILCSLLYIIYALLKAALRRRKGSWFNLFAVSIFLLAVLNDVLYYSFVINTGDFVGVGLFLFIFAQTLVLASKFSSAFLQVVKLSDMLLDTNKNLEIKVKERTKELEESNRLLRKNISIDGLTNVRNRRFYDETIIQLWKESKEDRTPISLIMADIDYFKYYNDCYGHQAGDECLKQVAQELEKIIDKAGFVTRYGGEEFAIILPNVNLEAALQIGEKLRASIEGLNIPNKKSKVSDYLTVSIGISSIVANETYEIYSFINAADNALYISKSTGRNKLSYEIPEEDYKR